MKDVCKSWIEWNYNKNLKSWLERIYIDSFKWFAVSQKGKFVLICLQSD